MKNKEKFAKEILDVACNGKRIAVTKENKVVCCNDINCSQCLFYKINDYGNYCDDEEPIKWAESEYVEKPTITLREKSFLDTLTFNCKYIARDGYDDLYIYYNKPIRDSKTGVWVSDNSSYYYVTKDIFGSMFDFIKWKDGIWSIEDLKKLEVKDENTTK